MSSVVVSPRGDTKVTASTLTSPVKSSGAVRTVGVVSSSPIQSTGCVPLTFTGHEPSPRRQRVGDYGPRVGASLSMRKTDLVVEDTQMRISGAGSSPTGRAASRTSASLSGRDLRDGIHISIPAPPPSWSGGGSQSSALHRSFLGSNSNGKPRPGQMVTVMESPFYTHKSSKEQLRSSELKHAEDACCTLSTQAAAAGVSRGGKSSPRSGEVLSSSYGKMTGSVDAVGAMMIVAPSNSTTGGSTSPRGTGTIVEISTKDSFDSRGEDRIGEKVRAIGGGGRSLIVSTRSIDRCVAETLAQGAIRKAEAEAVSGEMFNTSTSPRDTTGQDKKEDLDNNPGYSGVNEDLGRDRALCSSPRFGHRSGALHKAANESHLQVGFAVAIAGTLTHAGPAIGSPRVPGEQPVKLDLATIQQTQKAPSSACNATSSGSPVNTGASTARARVPVDGVVPPFMVASPRFPRDAKNTNPPVGHYHARHHTVDGKLVRDVHFGSSKKDHYDAKKVAAAQEQERLLAAEEKTIRAEVARALSPNSKKGGSEVQDDEAGSNAQIASSAFMRPIPRVLPRGLRNNSISDETGAPTSITSTKSGTNLGVGTAVGGSPFGDFNEDMLSTNKRAPCFAKLGKATGRDRQEGWDRTPDPTKPNTSSEAYYTGASLGNGVKDAKSTTKVLINMDSQSGRSVKLHSHLAAQHALAGGIAPGKTQPATSLDSVVVEDPHKFRNTLGTGKTSMVNMDKQAVRTSLHSKNVANTVSSDFRGDALSVVFDGKSSTKTPRPPTDFSKQVARPNAHTVSTCAVDSYDTNYEDGRGGVVEGLRAKNDLLSPRTRNADFTRMGSHTDTSSFANLADRNKQHDAAHGVGHEELTAGLNQTRPRIIRDVDFANLAPRKDGDRSYPTYTESCANVDNIFPKHILEVNSGGNPFMSKHIDRETRTKTQGSQPARLTDNFYDYTNSYKAELGKTPKNPVNISKSSGRDASGLRGNTSANPGSPIRGGSTAANTQLGPGTYDPKFDGLSKPTITQK